MLIRYGFLLLFFLKLLSHACRKPDPYVPPVRTYTYYKNTGLADFQAFRLFTRNGEIKNDSLVNAYTNQFRVHFYSPGDPFGEKYLQRFAVVSDDSMLNVSSSPVFEAKRTLVGSYDLYATKSNVFMNDTNDIHLKLLTYKTIHSRRPGGTVEYFEWENPSYLLKKSNDSLLFPINKYIIVYRGQSITSFRSDHFNNILSVTGTSQLAANDTLLIQQFHLVMKRE